jgi:hypothetical protein
MIGKKTAKSIRAELLEECKKSGIDPADWFDKQLRKLESGNAAKPYEIETLKLIRDGLKTEPRRRKARSKAVTGRSRRRS